MAAAVSTTGKTISLTAAQPNTASTLPDPKDPIAIEPKIRKSLKL